MAKKRIVVAIDGEGHDIDGKPAYAFLQAYPAVRPLVNRTRTLSTDEILLYLTTNGLHDTLNIGYSLDYDVNHWISDLSREQRQILADEGTVQYKSWVITWIPGKMIVIGSGAGGRRNPVIIYDLFSYFNSAFTDAYQQLTGKTPRAAVTAGKQHRSNFHNWTTTEIEIYNTAELEAMIELFSSLRSRVYKMCDELKITVPHSWHGPGALATSVLDAAGYDRQVIAYAALPGDVQRAAWVAYYGGRFEHSIKGVVDDGFTYDIRSAYPSAIAELPDLRQMTHRPVKRFETGKLGLYRVRWKPDGDQHPVWMPLPIRHKQGQITFPMAGEGWYWSVELEPLLSDKRIKTAILEGFVFENIQPYAELAALTAQLYAARQTAKAKKSPLELAYKLALNNLYGKMAQRKPKPGRFFNVLHAGLLTAIVRRRIYDVLNKYPDDVMAVATDGILSFEPLPLGGDGLGSWEAGTLDCSWLVAPGVIIPTDDLGIYRTRGISPAVVRAHRGAIADDLYDHASIVLTIPMFITHQLADAHEAMEPYRLKFIGPEPVPEFRPLNTKTIDIWSDDRKRRWLTTEKLPRNWHQLFIRSFAPTGRTTANKIRVTVPMDEVIEEPEETIEWKKCQKLGAGDY